MPIDFNCHQCQNLLRVDDAIAGNQAKCSSCGAINQVPFASPHNPYSAPQAGFGAQGPPALSNGQIVPTPVGVGDIIDYAMNVWKANLGLLVGVTVAVMGISVVFAVLQNFIQVMLQRNDDPVLLILLAVVILVGNVIQIFLGIGQCRISLKLLRGEPTEFSDLFTGGSLFLPVFGGSILAGLAVFLGIIACIVPGILLVLFFWPFYFLIVDQKTSVIDSFGVAYSIAGPNAGTSFVVWLASVGIMLLGFLALCVGVIFAAPLVSLMWATAYLMMSGQLAPKRLY